MKLYIDTNTYTSYISLTSDIKSLEKLKKLLIDKKVELVLPSQTKEEYAKHFKERVDQAKDKLKEKVTQVQQPKELKGKKKEKYTKEEKEISDKIDLVNAELKKLVIKRTVELKKHLESVEKLLKDIFKLATPLEDNDEIVLKAVIRQAKGLPPKKDNFKFGDAIIWETLKAYIRTESISIVSSDPDFSETNKKGKPAKVNKILKTEWKKHTKKEITLYSLLGHFVNSIEKENPISSETIKKEAIQATNYAYSPVIFGTVNVQDPYPILNNSQLMKTSLGDVDSMGRFTISANNVGMLIPNHNSISAFGSPSTLGVFEGNSVYSASSLNLNSPVIGGFQAESGILSVRPTNICTRCGKTYHPYSITTVHLLNICSDCSKYFSL
jgi:hypothetical protein